MGRVEARQGQREGEGKFMFFFCSSDTTLLTVKHFEMVKPGKSILELSAN